MSRSRASARSSRRSRRGRASAEPTPARTPNGLDGPAGVPALRPERRGPLREDGPQRDRVRDDGRDRRGAQHPQARRRRHRAPRSADAETTPLRDPEAYQYTLDVAEIAELWRRGSVVGSWLVDLIADALATSPSLDDFSGRVSDSGEGRWTVLAAVDESVPAPVITASLFGRFESRGEGQFAAKVLSAMRSEFGGHVERSS